ncbi:HIT family protein [Pseudomonas citri]|uniref:HIT family protein n=1 Tax=Pseudomonas citri TaxID=2978349 RepID=UPI0036F3136F
MRLSNGEIISISVTLHVRQSGQIYRSKQFNGAAAGQTVYHIHVQIIPRWDGEEPGEHAKHRADPVELETLQARLVERIHSNH